MNSRPSNELCSANIKAEAQRLGFFACGIAQAHAVSEDVAKAFEQWVSDGGYADMDYMARNIDKRLHPDRLMPGVKSIISVALNYASSVKWQAESYEIATYALGRDYHEVMKQKLRSLATALGLREMRMDEPLPQDGQAHCRVFCDTAPVLERYWAVEAGLGWTGRNHQLIVPHAGSMFFLGELFVDVELDYDKPQPNRCGTCHRCEQACPTGAIGAGNIHFNASKCLSWATIENKGGIEPQMAAAMGQCIYGCDRCQKACPWNRFAQPNTTAELQPKTELQSMTKTDWQTLTEEHYRSLFSHSAVKRAKYVGLMRNIKAADKPTN